MSLPAEFLDAVRAEVSIREWIGKSVPLKRNGREYKGLCPFHPEKSPSFTVYDHKFHCFGCGERGDVIDFVQKTQNIPFLDAVAMVARDAGMGMPNGYAAQYPAPARPIAAPRAKEPQEDWQSSTPPKDAPAPALGGFDAVYTYRDANGFPTRYIARKNAAGDAKKKFVPFSWGTLDGKLGWHKKQSTIREPYNLDQIDSRPDAPVLITEGEKAADAAAKLLPSYVVTTWSGGTSSALNTQWSALQGREVVIWPDNDEAGRKCAGGLADYLAELGALVTVLDISDLPEKFDAADLNTPDPEAWLAGRLRAPILEPEPIGMEDIPFADAEPPMDDDITSLVRDLNQKYAVVNESGKAVIFKFGYDALLKRSKIDRLSKDDFNMLYMNDKVRAGSDKDGGAIYKTKSALWLNHRDRKQYIEGVTFDPTGTLPQDGVLNLWKGFAIQPKQGDWSLMKSHIFSILCGGDKIKCDYLMGWLARMVQFPAEQGEVAVVMKSGEGTGKGLFAKALLKIIGQHGLAVSNAKHLTSNFNGHLRDAIFLFADEAFFAGDRAHVGVLKSIITEPYLTVEAKHQNAVQMPNFLHIMMASNEDWVIPASVDARRFFVLDVSEEAKSNHEYFGDLIDQMEEGGHAAMLHDLLAIDLTHFNVRSVPKTEGLQQQQKLSLPTPELWWKDCLERGYVFRSKVGLDRHISCWFEMISTELLFASYSEFAEKRRERNPMSRETLGRFMTKMGYQSKRFSGLAPVGEHLTDEINSFGGTTRVARLIEKNRQMGYALGPLSLARLSFSETTTLRINWEDDDAI